MTTEEEQARAVNDVVEAARRLEKATELYEESYQFMLERLAKKQKATEALNDALKKLRRDAE